LLLVRNLLKNQFQKEVRVGSNIYIKDTKFKVIGILKSVGNPEDDKNAYFPIDTLRDIYESGDQVHFIYATVNENYDINLAASNIELLLEKRLGEDTVNVMTLEQMMEQLDSILLIVKMTLGGIALVSLIIGAFGIINTMFVIITEKTKDIGVMKAVGATNSNIFLYMYLRRVLLGFWVVSLES